MTTPNLDTSYDIIDYVVGENASKILLLDVANEDIFVYMGSRNDIPDEAVGWGSPVFDMVAEDGKCLGVVSDALPPELASFSMSKDGVVLYAYVFESPVGMDDIAESFNVSFPAPWTGWDVVYYDMFPSADQLFSPTTPEFPLDGVEDAEVVGEKPEYWNDAEVIGSRTEAMENVLARPMTFMVGEMWGARDRRNTQDGDWKSATMPLNTWINGGAKTANTPAWGFSNHPQSKHKEGSCVVLGESIGGARTAKSMKTMHAIGLDIDSGAKLDTVIGKIQELGLFALIYTSYNHGKSGLQLKRDDVLRKLGIASDPTLDQIKEYLGQHDKNRYETDYIASVSIRSAKKQVKSGVVIELDTKPLEKFRIIFPLAESIDIIDLAETQAEALSVWEDSITGVAVNTLGVHFDTACTDPSRLFYTARHAKSADDWYCSVIGGDPLRFEDIQQYKKTMYTKKREKANAFEMAAGDDFDAVPQCVTPSGMSLNTWHSDIGKDRFMLADLIEGVCGDKVRVSGGEASGTIHTECPFEHEHTSEGGTATMAINSLDADHGVWTWFCHHDACQGRHKLQMLEEALSGGWFDESLLLSDEYVMPPEDEEVEEDEVEDDAEESGEESDTINKTKAPKTLQDHIDTLHTDSSDAEITAVLKKAFRDDLQTTERSKLFAAVAKATSLGKREITAIWKSFTQEAARLKAKLEKQDMDSFSGSPVVNEWDFIDLCKYSSKRLLTTNEEDPKIFHYMETLVVIREDASDQARIHFVSRDGFANLLNTACRYVRVSGDSGSSIGVSAPQDVVSHLYSNDFSVFPHLKGVVTSPCFSSSGKLIDVPGYHAESRLYYRPSLSLAIPDISADPTDEEVTEAKRLLIEEVLADFPLGGRPRDEMVQEVLHSEAGVASVANMVSLMLLPFVREMIDGPTPGYLFQKSTPGTGASLLSDVFSIIATGSETPAMALPASNDEMGKTLTSVLANGQNIVFFDNINTAVDSGELASAMTTPTYSARILGKSQTIEVDVRCAWVFTGNNLAMSQELVRRLVMVDLDAGMANPALRTGFRHRDIRSYARENRGQLVWACLTLVQNWIAAGMPPERDSILASYENWSRVSGGILASAGIGGFMGNRSELIEQASDNEDDGFLTFLEDWFEAYGTKEFYIRGTDDEKGLIDLAVAMDASLQVRKDKDMDGNVTLNARSFGSLLKRYRGRVFQLESGVEVSLLNTGKHTRRGTPWFLTIHSNGE